MKRLDRQRLSDEELASRARAGDSKAFAELWERHVRPGYAAARNFSSIADPDDIVSEAYLRIFRAIRSGGGPHEAFRPYLYRTIRNVALGWRTTSTLLPLDDADDIVDERVDIETTTLENTIIGQAFRSLPQRWQTILWYTEVEGMDPAEAAPLVGLSAGATAALAYRARDGLKNAWLQAHVSDHPVPLECHWTTERMGEYARGGLTSRGRERFTAHLATCVRCSTLVEDVDQVSVRLAAFLLPATIGGAAGAQMLLEPRTENTPSARPPSTKTALPTSTLTVTAASTALVGTIAVAVTLALLGPSLMKPTVDPETSERTQVTQPETDGATETTPPIDISPKPPAAVIPVMPPEPPTALPPVALPDPPTDPNPTSDTPLPPADPDTAPPANPDPTPPADPDTAPPADPDPTQPATPVVDSPAEGTLTAQPAPTFAGTGEPGALVEVRWDSTTGIQTIASATVGDDGRWVAIASTNLPDGAISLLISQVDPAGNRSAPIIRTLTIDTVALAPVLHPAGPGPEFFLPAITGEAEPFAFVELLDENTTLVGTANSDATGTWAIPLPDPGRDDQILRAQQTDPAGNLSPPSVPRDPTTFERPAILTPLPGESLPSSGENSTVVVQLAGVPGMRVQVLIDNVATGNLHTLEDAPISRVTPPLPAGTYTIGVRYIDTEGKVGSLATVTFTVF